MYFYNISEGCYSDYSYNIITHEKKFTQLEFVQMFNECVKEIQNSKEYEWDSIYSEEIVELMVEKYGFVVVKETWEINIGYSLDKDSDLAKEELATGEYTTMRLDD